MLMHQRIQQYFFQVLRRGRARQVDDLSHLKSGCSKRWQRWGDQRDALAKRGKNLATVGITGLEIYA